MARGAYKSFDKPPPAKPGRKTREPAEPALEPAAIRAAGDAERELIETEQEARATLTALDRQSQEIRRAIKIKRARDKLVDFCEYMMPDPEFPDDVNESSFKTKPHHKLLIEAVEEVEAKRMMRSAYSLPPQHGKTSILSLFGLAWIIGRSPHMRVIVGVYSETRAEKVGSLLRDILLSERFRDVFPKCVMKKGSKAKDDMEFVGGGQVILRGRGTATTGEPCDLFLIDDPIKDAIEAASPVTRLAVKEWYSAVVFSRCHVGTPIMIVHTRWSDDDLIGWLCDPEHPENKAAPGRTARWKYINIPAVVKDRRLAKALGIELRKPTDPVVIAAFGDVPMAALWDERFPLRHLAESHGNNARTFSALYQGEPAPEDGDFFRDSYILPYHEQQRPPLSRLRIYAASDHAVGVKQRNDPTCLLVVGVDQDNGIWLLDCWWDKAPADKVAEKMIDLMERWRPIFWWAESGHISKSMGPFLRKRMAERKVYINLVEQHPAADKVTRAQSINGRMAMGMVRFPSAVPWYEPARKEILKFPNGRHDDFVDTLAHIGLGLDLQSGPKRSTGIMNGVATAAVGTLNWVKSQARLDSRRDRRMAAIRNL